MPLKEKVKAQLIKQVEENPVLFWGHLDVELYFSSQHTLMVSGISHYLFNGVLRSQPSPISSSEFIQKIISEFKWRKLPFTWWTDARINPAQFGKQLESYGMTHLDTFSGMALELFHNPSHKKRNEKISVLPVTGSELMADWSIILDFYFGLDESIRHAYVDYFLNKLVGGQQPFRHYLASYGGTPAGAATLFIHNEVGGIYNLCVAQEFREKGVATALVDEIVESAKLCGCRSIVAMVPQKSHGLFHSLGFQKLCQFDAYVSPGAIPFIPLHPYSTDGGI